MDKVSFFHCADVHLGTPFKILASKPNLPALRRKKILDSLKLLIDKAKIEKPDFLFISGDLFEHEYTGIRTVNAVNNLFSSIPDTQVVMISGNHDPEAANSHYVTYKWCENVSFITKNIKSIYFEELNTEVFGLGWVLGTGQAALLNDMNLVPTRINVLLFHGDVDLQIGIRDYNSISSQLLETKSFDYIAAGHNHKRKTGEINGIFYNPGSLEPLGFDEPGIHGFFSGTIIKGMSPDVAFIKNSSTIYETIKIDINGISKNHQIIDEILPKLTSLNHLYKIILTGNKSLDYNPDTTYITSALEDKALFIKLVDNSKVWVSINELSLLKGLKGIFARKMLEKMKNSDEFEQKLLEKALYYGIEAIENGRIEQAGGDLL